MLDCGLGSRVLAIICICYCQFDRLAFPIVKDCILNATVDYLSIMLLLGGSNRGLYCVCLTLISTMQ